MYRCYIRCVLLLSVMLALLALGCGATNPPAPAAPTAAPAPTPAWQRYEHHHPDQQKMCLDSPNFSFDTPSGWRPQAQGCDQTVFTSPDRTAAVSFAILDVEHFDDNPSRALLDMKRSMQRIKRETEGGVVRRVLDQKNALIEHNGSPALSRTLLLSADLASSGSPDRAATGPTPEGDPCDEMQMQLLLPSPAWESGQKQVVMFSGTWCADLAHHEPLDTQALSTFRFEDHPQGN